MSVQDVPVQVGNTVGDGSGTPTNLKTTSAGQQLVGNTVKDGSGTAYTPLVDSSGRLLPGAPAGNGAPAAATMLSEGAVGTTGALAVTFAAVALKTNYVSGIQITGLGATSAALITVTLVGLLGGTRTWYIACPEGATLQMAPLIVPFPIPIPASAVNTALVLNTSAPGSGGGGIAANMQGYVL